MLRSSLFQRSLALKGSCLSFLKQCFCYISWSRRRSVRPRGCGFPHTALSPAHTQCHSRSCLPSLRRTLTWKEVAEDTCNFPRWQKHSEELASTVCLPSMNWAIQCWTGSRTDVYSASVPAPVSASPHSSDEPATKPHSDERWKQVHVVLGQVKLQGWEGVGGVKTYSASRSLHHARMS